MPETIQTYEAAKAQEELQKLFNKRQNALQKDPNHVWDNFEVVKVGISGSSPQKFQILLSCRCCKKTISASNPYTSMPRHIRSGNCSAGGNSIYVSSIFYTFYFIFANKIFTVLAVPNIYCSVQ
jgi:hypothetical protein